MNVVNIRTGNMRQDLAMEEARLRRQLQHDLRFNRGVQKSLSTMTKAFQEAVGGKGTGHIDHKDLKKATSAALKAAQVKKAADAK